MDGGPQRKSWKAEWTDVCTSETRLPRVGSTERSGRRDQALSDVSSPHIPFLPSSLEPLPNLRSDFYAQLLAYSHLLYTHFPFLISDSWDLLLQIWCPGLGVHQTDTRLFNAAWLYTG